MALLERAACRPVKLIAAIPTILLGYRGTHLTKVNVPIARLSSIPPGTSEGSGYP